MSERFALLLILILWGGSLWIKIVTWEKIPMILPRLMKKLFFIFVAHYLKIKSDLELLFAVFQLNLIKFNSKWAVLASVEKMQCMIYQISSVNWQTFAKCAFLHNPEISHFLQSEIEIE